MPHPAERPDTADLIRGRTRIGDFDLTVCTDGYYLLDGGAMFGVVPKPLWEKRAPADEMNRILLGLNTVVLRDGKQTIVIETGIGDKLPEKMREIHQAKQLLPQSLLAAGVKPEEVDVVINTHLHFDHCGWNTTLAPDGKVVPTFPNARYFAHQGEVDHGHKQYERDRVSYISANYDPLIENGQMRLFALQSGEKREILPHIALEIYPGHTRQLTVVHIESGGKHAAYISDLVPTTAHADITWVMGYDLDPLRCIEERKRLYSQAVPEQWLLLFTHDHHTPMAHVEIGDKGKPVIKPLETRP